MAAPSRIGFVGLGAMGAGAMRDLAQRRKPPVDQILFAVATTADVDPRAAGLALNLQKDLAQWGEQPLLVYNRTAAKAEPLVAAGAQAVGSVAELAAQCGVVFTMLTDDGALTQVFDSFAAGGPPLGAVFADMSTVLPATTAALAAAAAEKGVAYLSCPVFGRPDAVGARKAVMVLSGPADAKARVRPLLEPLGRAVLDAGDAATQGSTMKLIGNFYIASAIELLAEGMTLGDAAGLQRNTLLQYFGLMFPGPVFEGYGSRMAADDFDRKGGTAGFSLQGGLKDVGHMATLAAEHKVHAPVIDVVLGHLRQAQAAGRGDDDWSALATAVRTASSRPATGQPQ